MKKFELHPLCTLFPRLSGGEFSALAEDIRLNGLRHPIVLRDGMILDGGNRYAACLVAHVEPTFVEFDGDNIVSFVLSANLHRRHMSAGQQAAIVASATDWAKAQTHGGDRKSDQGEGLHLETVAQRAATSGATTRTQKDADRLVREHPEKAKEVAQGKTSLYKAVQETKAASDVADFERKLASFPPPATGDDAPAYEEDDGAPSAEEVASLERAEQEERAALQALLDADDKLKLLHDENAQLRALNRGLQSRIDGLLNQSKEQISKIKSLQRKLDKLGEAA